MILSDDGLSRDQTLSRVVPREPATRQIRPRQEWWNNKPARREPRGERGGEPAIQANVS